MPKIQPQLRQVVKLDDARQGQHKAISRAAILENVAGAEVTFRRCWRVVEMLVSGRVEPDSGQSIIDFQTDLLPAIVALESQYRHIRQEEKRLIARKGNYSLEWFKRRMAALDSHKKPLLHALAIGRALGDGFAWFFYERDRQLILEHHKHQRQVLLPPSDGGLGERLALENLQGFDKKLLLYHGLTSFLRLGDVSLIDLKQLRVACIGELKTTRVSDEVLNLQIDFIAGKRDALPKQAPLQTSTRARAALPQALEARRERQVREMRQAIVNAAVKRATPIKPIDGDFHYDKLDEVVSRSHCRAFEYVQAGPSLILGAVRLLRPGELLKDIYSRRRSVDRLARNVAEWALKILDPRLPNNSILLGDIGSGPDELAAPRSGLPLLWWGTNASTLRQILFGEVLVLTIYNPAHLWAQLQERGFELEFTEKGKLKHAHRRRGDKLMELHNFDYFHHLVTHQLMRLESVCDMIEETIRFTSEASDGRPLKVEIDPVISRRPKRSSYS